MQLTSEVEAIMNGSVVRKEGAVDKAIGVSTINLQPNENGIVPLSSQSSFKLETPAVAPSQAPKDTLEEVPIAVAATDNMGTFNIPSPETPLVSEELPAEEKVDVPLNIDMPQMPETVLAEEPTSINNSMFATTPVESQEVKSAEVQTPEVTPEVVPQAPVAPENVSLPTLEEIIPTLLLLCTKKSPEFGKYSILSYLGSIITFPFKSITAYDLP